MIVMAHFVMANTVFMHTHRGFDGNTVTHSHPYLPSGGHAHSQQALDALSLFNAAAGAFNVSAVVAVAAYTAAFTVLADACHSSALVRVVKVFGLRGPPQCMV